MTARRAVRTRPIAPEILALLQETGHFGKIGTAAREAHPATEAYALARGLRAMASALPEVPRRARLWRLLRRLQLDQGNTPWCCPTTGKHWERSSPVTQQSGLTNGDLYGRCKQLDGYPDEEGTDGHAMLEVYRALGMLGGFFWAFDDTPAVRDQVHRWLADVGPMWWGAFWSYEMCTTDAHGVIDPGAGALELGHETLVLGSDQDMFGRGQGGKVICNSWPLGVWGLEGRGLIRDDDFFRVLAAQGDLAGVMQTVRPPGGEPMEYSTTETLTGAGLMESPALRLALPFAAMCEIWPARRMVTTLYAGGAAALELHRDTPPERDEAAWLRLPADAGGTWHALVERHVLRSVLMAELYGKTSAELSYQAGLRLGPSRAIRCYETGIVLSFQRWLHTQIVGWPLDGISGRERDAVRAALARALPVVPPLRAPGQPA